jgi:hypothetical protein
VLFIYAERVGEAMGGVGIRAVELARTLRDELGARVTIAAAQVDGGDVGVPVATFAPHAPRALAPLLARADAVVAQPGWPLVMRALARSHARLVFDLYDPEAFGTLEHFAGRDPRLRALMGRFAVDRLLAALRLADHVMCANERQRDLWLGAMLAARLITAERHDADPSLRSLLDVVPFGLPEQPASAAADGPREAFPGRIGADDEVVLWNGGLWPWLDAETAVRAVAALARRRPSAKLVFMGAARQLPAQRAADRAHAVASELGVLDHTVLFNEEWVPYERRADWLQHAACAISTHGDHLETRFAFRTRLLDCLWARLPIVCTGGDDLADVVERAGAGHAVAAGDVEGAAGAIETVLDRGRDAYARALGELAERYRWPVVAEPLARMIAGPPPPAADPPALRASQSARRSGYLAVRLALNAVGLKDRPRL